MWPVTQTRLAHHDHEIAVDTAGDERLRSVQDEVVASAYSSRSHCAKIGTGARLRHCNGREQSSRAETAEPSFALLGRRQLREIRDGNVVIDDALARIKQSGPAELLLDD